MPTLGPCTHFTTGVGECGEQPIGGYGGGPRCAEHTPARLAGRPETIPDPARTMDGIREARGLSVNVPMTPPGDTVVDMRAKASGKRRSSPNDYRAAQAAAEQTVNRTWGKPDLRVVGTPQQAAAAAFDPDGLKPQTRKVFDALSDGHWHTLRQLSDASGAPEASVSARMRDLRGEEYALPLEAEKMPGSNLWRYRLTLPDVAAAG